MLKKDCGTRTAFPCVKAVMAAQNLKFKGGRTTVGWERGGTDSDCVRKLEIVEISSEGVNDGFPF